MMYALLITLMSGCSFIQKKALSSVSSELVAANQNLTRESSYEYFRESLPGNLKFIEGLHYINPTDLKILQLLIKGHSAYAFGVMDTQNLENKYNEADFQYYKKRLINHYSKALYFGELYLKAKGLELKDLKARQSLAVLDANFSEEDAVALFYMAQGWGEIINAHRNDIFLVGELGYVERILNWVCANYPNFEEGTCDLYKAVFLAQKPRMLGGSPLKAKNMFERAIKRFPKNLLFAVSLIEHVYIPTSDSVSYYKMKKFLNKEFQLWERAQTYSPSGTNDFSQSSAENLFNAIAQKRFRFIKQFEQKLFVGEK